MAKELTTKQNMLYNTIGSVFYLACQWLITIIVVHLGNFDMAGNLTVAISLSNTFSTIATYGVKNYQVSDMKNTYSSSEYVSNRLFTCIASLLLAIGFLSLNTHYTSAQMGIIFAYIFYRIVEAFTDVLQGIQQKAFRMDYIGIELSIRGITTLVGFTAGLYFFHSLILSICFMIIPTLLVILTFDIPISLKLDRFKPIINKHLFSILKHCFPLMITSFLTTNIVTIPRYFLEKIQGSTIAGYYGSVATPTVIIQSLCLIIYSPLVPLLARAYTDSKLSDYKKIMSKALFAMLTISILFCLIAILLGRWSLHLLFGDAILPYTYLFTPIVLTTIMMAFLYFFTMVLTIARRTWTIVISTGCAALAVTLLSKPMIHAYSMDGVNYCLYIGLTVALLIMIIVWITDTLKHFTNK